MSNNCSCGGCGCAVCQPANVVFSNPCTDPGAVAFGAHAVVLDQNMCQRRVNDAQGFNVANATPSGYQISYTTEPNVNLSNFAAGSGATIGSILVRNADGIIRTLLPAAVAGLYLGTNALGQLVFGALPASTVPDPLAVTTLSATTATFGSLTVTGPTVKFTGLIGGTIASTVGLDASGNLVIGSPSATGVQCAMFYESSSSPGPGTPNGSATAGSFLIIGNQLYDSGATLIGVTNSTTLKALVAGKYKIDFCGQVAYTSGGTGTPAIQLVVNGIIVNTGNTRPSITSTSDRTCPCAGFEMMDLAVNDTIKLQLSSSAGTHTHVYEARVGFEKFA